ncbi:MAG: DNA recombination protein RmuC [Phocaeicola sp.]|uniref:DNA recombination protein RmuC n=1 Tax=Phocaeicola sp. TaxID=2773926 RepID=UPI003F9EE6C7
MDITVISIIVLCFIIGITVGYFFAHSRMSGAVVKLKMTENENQKITQQLSEKQIALETLNQEYHKALSEVEVMKSQVESWKNSTTGLKESFEQQKDELKRDRDSQLTEQKAQYEKMIIISKEEASNQLGETKKQYEQTISTLKENAEKQLNETKRQYEVQLESQKQERDNQLSEQKLHYEKSIAALKESSDAQKAEMKEHYRQQLEEFHTQQKSQMEQQSHLIREQINTASEEILKKRSEELSTVNKEQMSAILNPLHENLRQMKEAVEKSDREQTETMARLDQSIKENMKQAQQVGDRADKLAQALTSENKAQGNFGELRLRTLLENMGLEEGIQFEEQVTMRDEIGMVIHEEENGRRMQPDVILHFPDERDVIIDSKMSLKAFEEYFDSDDEKLRSDALSRHILSVRNHVKELAHKDYSRYLKKGHNKLDFVVMYIYSESALQLALANDPSIWKEAYDQGVVISGSQNLYMMLRVLEMTWRQVRQVENQDNIMATANELVNRVQMFYERFNVADEQLGKTRQAFDNLKKTTAPTGKSIITAANNLIKFGAKENSKRKYNLPKSTDNDDSMVALDGAES